MQAPDPGAFVAGAQQRTTAAWTLVAHKTNANAIAPIDPRRIVPFMYFLSTILSIDLSCSFLPQL